MSMNGIDYIILGAEEYNKDFDVTDADKLIMSESKGALIGFNNDEEENEDSKSEKNLLPNWNN